MANDHYVPQFYLKSFQAVTGKVWCYERVMPPRLKGVKSVACTDEYYSIKAKHLAGDKRRIDNTIGQLESVSSPIYKKLLTGDRITLTQNEKRELSIFFAHLYSRTPLFRETMKNLHLAAHKMMAKISAQNKEGFKWNMEQAGVESTPEELEELRQSILDIDNRFNLEFTEESDDFFLKTELEVVMEIVPFFYGKHWHIIKSSTSRVFATSDHPVVLLPPSEGYSPYWGLGLVNAIIALPLTPKRCLFMSDKPGKADVIEVSRESVNTVNQFIFRHAHKQVFANMFSQEFQTAFDKTTPGANTKVAVS